MKLYDASTMTIEELRILLVREGYGEIIDGVLNATPKGAMLSDLLGAFRGDIGLADLVRDGGRDVPRYMIERGWTRKIIR